MSDVRPQDAGETPSIEVLAYRDGKIVDRQLCESPEEAAAAVEAWEQNDGIECVVRNLSGHLGPGDVSEPELGDTNPDDYSAQ